MALFGSAKTSREDEAPVVRDGNSAIARLVRFTARMLLWGCVLLLIVRGILSEFRLGPQTVTTTRGVTGTVSAPPTAHPAQSSEGK
jgi:hypothetical protein